MYENEPRNWKWGVPAVFVPVFGTIATWLLENPVLWAQMFGLIAATITLVLLLMTLINLWRYVSAHQMDLFTQRQQALSTTPVTLMAQALSGMHPEAVKVLDKFGVRTVWQVKVDLKSGDRDFILLGTNVHYAFIQFVLDHSNPVSLMPKRSLSDGSKKFDPDGLVTDYQQYDEFQQWLIGRLVVTRPFGDNHPCMFLPPWNVEMLGERMGCGDAIELEQPKEHESEIREMV